MQPIALLAPRCHCGNSATHAVRLKFISEMEDGWPEEPEESYARCQGCTRAFLAEMRGAAEAAPITPFEVVFSAGLSGIPEA